MFSICMRMLNNTGEAEDALQESFISAFKNLHQYNADASFGSWLKRIVINRCIDQLKRKNLLIEPLDGTDVAEETAEDHGIEYSPEAIRQALAELPDGYRVILSLYLFEDYSHKMIAEKLGISEGTSKSQYARGRQKLAALIIQNTKHHER